MPLVPVSLDWVFGLMLEPMGRSGLVRWGVGTEAGAERGAGDMAVMDVMGIELVMILGTGWLDSVLGRASATVCEEAKEEIY